MKEKTKEIISIISYIIFLIMSLFILIFSVMISKSIALANYIIFSFCMLVYVYLIISFIIYKKKQETKQFLSKLNTFSYSVFIIILFIECLAYTINILYYEKYRKICPFTLEGIDFKNHLSRRCELYNINSNSRYSFQYICTYNPSDEFKNIELDKDEYVTSNKLEIMQCLLVNNLINNDYKVLEFGKEYNGINKFYCSLVFKPKSNNYIDSSECQKNRSKINFSFLSLIYIQLLFNIIKSIIFKSSNNNDRIINEEIERNSNRNRIFHGLIGLNRLLNLLRELINMDININLASSQASTQRSEEVNDNEDSFEAEKTKNIIIDNKNNYEINIDINNFYKESQNDSINLNQINIGINNLNSNENIMNEQNNSNNNV